MRKAESEHEHQGEVAQQVASKCVGYCRSGAFKGGCVLTFGRCVMERSAIKCGLYEERV